jgi:hypothetical protein
LAADLAEAQTVRSRRSGISGKERDDLIAVQRSCRFPGSIGTSSKPRLR